MTTARPDYLSVAIYAARSSASFRDSPMSGIFGCGSSRNSAILAASKPGVFAILANGGAWSVVSWRCVAEQRHGKLHTIDEPAVHHCPDPRRMPASTARTAVTIKPQKI